MRIEGDPIPFRAAQAYGVPAIPANVRVDPVLPVQRQSVTSRIESPEVRVAPTKIDRLVGAQVPGGIDFSAEDAQPATPKAALPFYTKPGQRNLAATSIVANTGRTLDVSG